MGDNEQVVEKKASTVNDISSFKDILDISKSCKDKGYVDTHATHKSMLSQYYKTLRKEYESHAESPVDEFVLGDGIHTVPFDEEAEEKAKEYDKVGDKKASATKEIPSFKDMLDLKKSGGDVHTMNTVGFGTISLGEGKNSNDLTVKNKTMNRDKETGKFVSKELNVQGCTKTTVELGGKKHDIKPDEVASAEPMHKSARWIEIAKKS